jgi:hypothetical protein
MVGVTNAEMRRALGAYEELSCDEKKVYFADAQVAPSQSIYG